MAKKIRSNWDKFLDKYIEFQMERHSGNKYWKTREDVIDNLGGIPEIYTIYHLWNQVKPETQKRVCGITYDELVLCD